MATSKVSVRVKVITDVEDRGTDKFLKRCGSCTVIESLSKGVKTLYLTEKHLRSFSVGQFYLLRSVVIGETLRAGDQTMVLSCSPFNFDPSVEEGYLNPGSVSVVEALASPKKRRISVTGTLSEVSDVLSTERSKRKILKLSDGHNNFVVKLWGEKACEATPPVGAEVTVKGLTVAEFRGEKEGNSSGSTCIVECAEEVRFEGVVDAAAFNGDESWMIMSNDETMLSLPSIMLQAIFNDLEFVPNVYVAGKRKGSRVLEVKVTGPQEH